MIIILLILSFLAVSGMCTTEYDDMISKIIFGLILGTLLIGSAYYFSKPTALDVYQGKTTLQYTIIDGIKTDSIVIFKDK